MTFVFEFGQMISMTCDVCKKEILNQSYYAHVIYKANSDGKLVFSHTKVYCKKEEID